MAQNPRLANADKAYTDGLRDAIEILWHQGNGEYYVESLASIRYDALLLILSPISPISPR